MNTNITTNKPLTPKHNVMKKNVLASYELNRKVNKSLIKKLTTKPLKRD